MPATRGAPSSESSLILPTLTRVPKVADHTILAVADWVKTASTSGKHASGGATTITCEVRALVMPRVLVTVRMSVEEGEGLLRLMVDKHHLLSRLGETTRLEVWAQFGGRCRLHGDAGLRLRRDAAVDGCFATCD